LSKPPPLIGWFKQKKRVGMPKGFSALFFILLNC
jgi:hypothetical protein